MNIVKRFGKAKRATFEMGLQLVKVRKRRRIVNAMGAMLYPENRVVIEREHKATVQWETLWHEGVEYANAQHDLQLDHRTIQTIGACMAQMAATLRLLK